MSPSAQPRTVVTGLVLTAFALGLVALVSGAMVLTGGVDSLKNPLDRVVFLMGFNFFALTICLVMAVQRLRIDPVHRRISYANISTAHLWRYVDAGRVQSIWTHTNPPAKHMYLRYKSPTPVAGWLWFLRGPDADLIEQNMTANVLSAHLEAVVRLVVQSNPAVQLSENLIAFKASDSGQVPPELE